MIKAKTHVETLRWFFRNTPSRQIESSIAETTLLSADLKWIVFDYTVKKFTRTRIDECSGRLSRAVRILEGTLTHLLDHRIEKSPSFRKQTNHFRQQQSKQASQEPGCCLRSQ
ncbi:hypothetical protein AVEN_123520-1 [Araneus ventricosus]|uniref:Uncharacterized protein n=1 Tax=Araneus ventricosus TaxID=182803 RepID=A0A4Y2P550_ARAVE|nr:hypothetical protein AVEN_123520-1 [Araneus ventricosus]